MKRDDLETLIHHKLAELPPPRAPRTLAPRVMAQVRRRQQSPWYGQPWIAWPRAWQVVSVTLLLGLCSMAWHVLEGTVVERTVGIFDFLGAGRVETGVFAVTDAVVALADSARILRRVILEPIAAPLMAVIVVVCMASALLGAALARLLQEREAGR